MFMSDDKVMGRRQFFSRIFPVLTETISEKIKDETKALAASEVPKKVIAVESVEAAETASDEGETRKYPWVGM